jgi:hypothetical protein
MALIVADRVQETSTTTGAGAYTLLGATTGYRAASTVCANTDTFTYYAEDVDASGHPLGEWETGLGTWGTGNILTRTTIYASSNAGAAVSWAAGTRRIGLGLVAETAIKTLRVTGTTTLATSLTGLLKTTSGIVAQAVADTDYPSISTVAGKIAVASIDASGGVPGLTLYKLNLKNDTNTFTNYFTNTTTASRTWTLPDKDGTVAMIADIPTAAVGGGTDQVFFENGTQVTSNYTITVGKNAMCAGPISVNSGVIVTVPSGSTLTVV